jgi:hypothetical protein
VPSAIDCWSRHPVIGRPIRTGGEGRLGELESPPLVVIDVGKVRGVQVTRQFGRVDDRQSVGKQCGADPAALGAGMDAQGFEVQNGIGGIARSSTAPDRANRG